MSNTDLEYPLVSAIIPAYNAERFIERTLNSILNQTYKNLEVLVVDDGSQDRTVEIVKAIAQEDRRVILLHQSNSGVARARNLAIAKAKGEYIAPIDADDIWYPQKIEKQVEVFLNSEPSVGLVYTWSVLIDEEDCLKNRYSLVDSFYFLQPRSIEGQVYLPLIYRNFTSNASVPLIHRTCFEKVGKYNELFKQQNAQGCEDWDLHLRIAEHYQFRVVPKFLVGYRQLSSSMSNNHFKMIESYNLVMQNVRERHPKIPEYIYSWSKSNFYIYLLGKIYKSEGLTTTVALIYKILKIDPKTLLKQKMYLIFLFSIIKQFLPKTIVFKFYRQLNVSKKASVPLETQLSNYARRVVETIEYLNPAKLQWKSPYQILLESRWHEVLRLNQLEINWRSPEVDDDKAFARKPTH